MGDLNSYFFFATAAGLTAAAIAIAIVSAIAHLRDPGIAQNPSTPVLGESDIAPK